MARKRVIYQSEALFVGPTGSNFLYSSGSWDSGQWEIADPTIALASNRYNTLFRTDDFIKINTTGVDGANLPINGGSFNTNFSGSFPVGAFASGLSNRIVQINRVQSANYSFDIARQDVNQYGQLGAIDRVILEQPTVSLDFSYYANSGDNEKSLGFTLGSTKGALADILSGGKDIQNYYILISPEGTDANVDKVIATGQGKVIGVGNAGLTSYSLEASVGGFPTVTVNAEALNMKFYAQPSGLVPTVNAEDGSPITNNAFKVPNPDQGAGYSALRPGDITLSVSGLGFNTSDLKIQSFTLSTDIGRDPIQKLGSKYAFSREITFPVTVNASVEAIVGDIGGSDNLGNALTDLVCDDKNSFDLVFTLGAPTTDCLQSTPPTRAMRYTLKGAKLDSQEVSSSIGDNKTVTLGFSAQIAGPTDTAKGLFIEGPS